MKLSAGVLIFMLSLRQAGDYLTDAQTFRPKIFQTVLFATAGIDQSINRCKFVERWVDAEAL